MQEVVGFEIVVQLKGFNDDDDDDDVFAKGENVISINVSLIC